MRKFFGMFLVLVALTVTVSSHQCGPINLYMPTDLDWKNIKTLEGTINTIRGETKFHLIKKRGSTTHYTNITRVKKNKSIPLVMWFPKTRTALVSAGAGNPLSWRGQKISSIQVIFDWMEGCDVVSLVPISN